MNKKRELYETIILFSVLFLPSIAGFGGQHSNDYYNSLSYNLHYLILAIPKLFLLLFVATPKPVGYGFKAISRTALPYALLIFLALWITVIALLFLYSFFGLPGFDTGNEAPWTFTSPSMLPLMFFVSIVTGYLEEGFFRCYLYTQFRVLGVGLVPGVLSVSILFGLAHGYQGLAGCISTAVMGIVLQICREKFKISVHPLGIGHGMYNFSVFLLAALNVSI